MKKQLIKDIIIAGIVLLTACTPKPEHVITSNTLPPIYPDYTDVTIPCNIAPLNFMLRNNADAMQLKVTGISDSIIIYGESKISFPIKAWKKLLFENTGKELNVEVTARIKGEWIKYKTFKWNIVADKIDGYLSYRLIEPGYEVWNAIQLCERNLENFDEKVIADNNQLKQSCMNCHIYGNQSGQLSMFHIRGKNGGTILNRDGKLRKLAMKTGNMISPTVYGAFHPSGRFAVFSTNIVIPEFHTQGSKRMEVYDTASDVLVADFIENVMIQSPLLSDSTVFETFPVFSADGKYLYFCSAPKVILPKEIKKLKYSLCRIAFDSDKKEFGAKVDTLWNARLTNKSISFPKTSPDGKYMLYSVSDYGTFPIWHRETDLQLMNLMTGVTDNLEMVNSNKSDTYHSWSSDSRWFVFASKRDDGQYGKPYLAYIDKSGKVHKPFVLPQKNPEYYDETFKSFNIPELSKSKLPYDAADIEKAYNMPTESFK